MVSDELARLVTSVIADTFDVPPEAISEATTADDVAGWDSLGHSVLMTRLARRLAIPLGEDIAGTADSVGELIAALRKLTERVGHAGA